MVQGASMSGANVFRFAPCVECCGCPRLHDTFVVQWVGKDCGPTPIHGDPLEYCYWRHEFSSPICIYTHLILATAPNDPTALTPVVWIGDADRICDMAHALSFSFGGYAQNRYDCGNFDEYRLLGGKANGLKPVVPPVPDPYGCTPIPAEFGWSLPAFVTALSGSVSCDNCTVAGAEEYSIRIRGNFEPCELLPP